MYVSTTSNSSTPTPTPSTTTTPSTPSTTPSTPTTPTTPTPTTPTPTTPTPTDSTGEVWDSVAKSLKTLKACYKKLQDQDKIIIELEKEVMTLRQENYELRSLPDAPDYLAAKERFTECSRLSQ